MKNKNLVWVTLILLFIIITQSGESYKIMRGGSGIQDEKPSIGDTCHKCMLGKSNRCGDNLWSGTCYFNILPNNRTAFRGCDVSCW